jgi:hypothetical protein
MVGTNGTDNITSGGFKISVLKFTTIPMEVEPVA